MEDREPCPWRIIDDVGGAFAMGSIGGSAFHTIKGSWNSSKGVRLTGAMNAVTSRAPILGGQFAVWGGIFACCDCTLTAVRQKEDPWNSIISGAATGGILAARAGPKAMTSAAVVGGVLLAMIEGMGIAFSKMMSPPMPSPEEMQAMGAVDPTAPPTMGGTTMMPTNTAPPMEPEPSSSGSSEGGLNPFEIFAKGGGSSGGGGDSFESSSFGSETKFSTESPSSQPEAQASKGWWPFGGSSN